MNNIESSDRQEEVASKRLSPKKEFKRRMAAGILAATIAFSGAGCAAEEQSIDETPSASIETVTDDPVKVTDNDPEVTIEVPSATPEKTPDAQTELEKQLAAAPEIDGLTKQIDLVNNRIIYIYAQGNVYGVEFGDNEDILAGVYKPNVEVEGDEAATGVCLDAVVCRYLTEARIAEIPEGEDKKAVALPFDIEDNNGPIVISNVDRTYNSKVFKYVEVKSDESMEIVGSYYPDTEESMFYSFSVNTVFIDGFTHSDGTVDSINGHIISTGYSLNNEMTSDNISSCLTCIIDEVDFVNDAITTVFGGDLGYDCNLAIVKFSDISGTVKDITLDDLVKVDNSYVFVSTVEGSESTGIVYGR